MYEILVVAIKWNGQFTYCWLSNMSYMYYFGSPRANIGLDESKLPWHTVPLNLLIVSISIEAVGSENMSKCTVCSIAKWVKYITERHASSSGILMCLFTELFPFCLVSDSELVLLWQMQHWQR